MVLLQMWAVFTCCYNISYRQHRYHLKFRVYDRKHTQTDVPANVTVTVREIPHDAVINSGSVRIAGLTDEDFIRVWNYRVRNFRYLFYKCVVS
jgi:hypothetical protein